jgi:urease accessory protein
MKKTIFLSAFATAIGMSGPALAHHAMGGETPDTLFAGLISGLAHPVIGIDHLAFIIAVGLAAAFTPKRYVTPLAFVAATLAGCGLLLAGVALPLAEIVITGSVVLVGGMVLSGRRFPDGGYIVLFAVAGLFHGWAYGASILGAETTPLTAYLAGFAAIQYAIALGVVVVTRTLWRAADPTAIAPRLTGALMAGIGFAFLVENIEGLLFA